MLLSLHIRDFAIIDELDIEFSPGMTALTGETGAGKSILLGALGLLLGDRADAGSVRHGAERAEISAAFDLGACEMARDWLSAHDMDSDDECHLRRIVAAEGRSRAYINGSPVPVASLRELGEHLVDDRADVAPPDSRADPGEDLPLGFAVGAEGHHHGLDGARAHVEPGGESCGCRGHAHQCALLWANTAPPRAPV